MKPTKWRFCAICGAKSLRVAVEPLAQRLHQEQIAVHDRRHPSFGADHLGVFLRVRDPAFVGSAKEVVRDGGNRLAEEGVVPDFKDQPLILPAQVSQIGFEGREVVLSLLGLQLGARKERRGSLVRASSAPPSASVDSLPADEPLLAGDILPPLPRLG